MIYYANPCSPAARSEMIAGRLGCITTPHQGNVIDPDWDVIADNGCFSGRWKADHWERWLYTVPTSARFAVAPDLFNADGNDCHNETVALWDRYAPTIRAAGLRPAFVCQPGATPANIPTDAAALFLGGTTDWKLGHNATACTRWANDRGVWVHMGRVNSRRRFRTARAMGCDSVDGTFLTFAPDQNMVRLLDWIDDAARAPMLWEIERDDGLDPDNETNRSN